MDSSLLQPGGWVKIAPHVGALSVDVRWNAGTQTAFSERLAVAALPLVRGRIPGRDHLVFDNQPRSPEGATRMSTNVGVIDIDLASVPQEVERIEVVVYVRPRPNAARRTLDQLDSLSVSMRDGERQVELARSVNLTGLVGTVAGASVADVVREGPDWAGIIQARGAQDGLHSAAAVAGIRL